MDRRRFVQLMGGTALSIEAMAMGYGRGRAQEAADLAALGLPEVTITLTDTGFEAAPASTPAGWTLVTFVNQQSGGDNSPDIMRLPEGETIDGLMEMLGAMDPESAPPAWIYEAAFAGGPWIAAGASARAVVRLTEGEWVVFTPEPLAPAALTVTAGDAAAAAPAGLSAGREVDMGEFFFMGPEEPVPAGAQVWKVTATGEQPHLMRIGPVPAGTTQEQLVEGFAAMIPGAPPADGDAAPPAAVGGCSTLSAGESIYLELDLVAGTYGAVCFFPDAETGAPHVMLGMVSVFSAG